MGWFEWMLVIVLVWVLLNAFAAVWPWVVGPVVKRWRRWRRR